MSHLKFSAGHVWVRVEGPDAVLGLSDYIQDQMGEITSLELPDIGDLIRAEVTSVDELVAAGSMDALRAAGKLRVEGRDYRVKDGDVIFFRIGR